MLTTMELREQSAIHLHSAVFKHRKNFKHYLIYYCALATPTDSYHRHLFYC
jgi:hypothetical protein